MSNFLVGSLILVAVLIAVGLYRVWAGPTVFDRLVAVALLSVNGVVVLVLLGFAFERPVLFIDIALGFALLAFLLPIALGRYFESRPHTTPDERPRRPRPRGIVPHGLLAERARRMTARALEEQRRAQTDPAARDTPPEAGR